MQELRLRLQMALAAARMSIPDATNDRDAFLRQMQRRVAEYVEDPPTLTAARELGIDYAQGHAAGHMRELEVY